MSLLHGDAPSKGYIVLPSGIGFTREQAAVMAAIRLFPGWKPMVDALRHLAIQSQDRIMNRYSGMEELQYERGFVAGLEEVVNLIEVEVPKAYTVALEAEERENNGRSEGAGGSDTDEGE